MKYRIYEEFYNDVEKKLKRIGKKCAKHGNPFTFEVVGEEIQEVENEETKIKAHYKFIIVEVEGTAKIDDYECVAVLENHEHGNVIRRINTTIDIPQRFLNTDNFCEHCNSKRRRNELYIIHNTETDEFKQVGSNCLLLYTKGLNAEYVAGYIDGITELEEYDGFIGGGSGKYYIPVEQVIEYATEIINKMGYFNSHSYCPTKSLVKDMLYLNNSLEDKIDIVNKTLRDCDFVIRFTEDDFHRDSTKEVAKNIINYYLNVENDSEFINNVQVILKDGYVEYQNVGFLCYLPEGYFKHIKKEIEKAKQKRIDKESNYFGTVGERYKDLNIYDMKVLANYETMFGLMYVYKIVLENGNILIWKTTSWFEELEKFKKIDFTIKAHNEYKDTKQTEVTRCKLRVA